MKNLTMNRRTFLKTTALAGSGLLVGCTFSSPKLLSTSKASEDELGLWVRIGTEDTVTLILPSSEMGQQAHTGQAMILAEELEADWNSIRVVTAPVDPEYGNPQQNNSQATGGSYSISAFWDKLRQIGAGTREMLMTAAARQWGVPVSECKAENGRVLHSASGRSLSYGRLAATAAKLSPPDDPVLKTPQQFRLIGKSIPKAWPWLRTPPGMPKKGWKPSNQSSRAEILPGWTATRSVPSCGPRLTGCARQRFPLIKCWTWSTSLPTSNTPRWSR